MTVIRAEQVQSRGDEETFRNRPEALGNRRAGKTTGEWSAHKLPRRFGLAEVGRTGAGLKKLRGRRC